MRTALTLQMDDRSRAVADAFEKAGFTARLSLDFLAPYNFTLGLKWTKTVHTAAGELELGSWLRPDGLIGAEVFAVWLKDVISGADSLDARAVIQELDRLTHVAVAERTAA